MTAADLLNETFDKIESRLKLKKKTSHFFEKGKFYVAFDEYGKAKPKVISKFYETLKNKTKCALILLDSRLLEAGCKLLEIETGLKYGKIMGKNISKDEISKIKKASEHLCDMKMEIVEMESCEVFEIIKECERLKNEEKCEVIFIDSLDFIYCDCWLGREKAENEIKNMEAVCYFLRTMAAEENDIAIITSYTTRNEPCKLDSLIERAARRGAMEF